MYFSKLPYYVITLSYDIDYLLWFKRKNIIFVLYLLTLMLFSFGSIVDLDFHH